MSDRNLVELMNAKWQGWNEAFNAILRVCADRGHPLPPEVNAAMDGAPSVQRLEESIARADKDGGS